MSYCPQVDALLHFMTPFELVKYMAMLRGFSIRGLNDRVNTILRRTDLQDYAHILVKNCSGGTKRKLSTALALVI